MSLFISDESGHTSGVRDFDSGTSVASESSLHTNASKKATWRAPALGTTPN